MKTLRWCLLLTLFWMTSAYAEVAVPALKGQVLDLTETLSAPQIQEIEGKITSFRREQDIQIVVLLVQTTEAESIEEYAARLVKTEQFEANHILFLVAKRDRKFRINVAGERLTVMLNDVAVQRIVSETITPLFKRGDFSGGIQAGINDLIQEVMRISPAKVTRILKKE